ncbi:hypothetical protein BDN72DRAFT_871723 [Pluteus cervinus]|uniref:Uncharacterized protein n=1 Tax=Pluteus cervinus TaxID=181527 RepID=A0ACD3AJV3_9AGAR|nr:hypothetical protein BDN72DRAFT_871723 [Pluteus cervinus]
MTLEDVRRQAIEGFVVMMIKNAKVVDGAKINICSPYTTTSASSDPNFHRRTALEIIRQTRFRVAQYLFIILTPPILLICASTDDYAQPTILLIGSKFIGRVDSTSEESLYFTATIQGLGESNSDEIALWDILQKAVRKPMDPLIPPPSSRGIAQILEDARAKLQRISPRQAYNELVEPQVGAPTYLVDIRPAAQRESEGMIYGSLIVERNVLEWRLDPRSDARLGIADRYDVRIILFCQEGYASSLAALSLQELGLLNATDIIGGYRAWKEAELPVELPPQKPVYTESTTSSQVA